MTRPRLLRRHLPTLTDGQWVSLQRALSQHQEWMVHSLGGQAGIPHKEARAVLLVLHALGAAQLFLNVYHKCTEAPVARLEYRHGFVRLPWACPECERIIRRENELGYELVCEPITQIELGGD